MCCSDFCMDNFTLKKDYIDMALRPIRAVQDAGT